MPAPKTIFSSAAFQDPQGNPLSYGALILDLSNPATVLGGAGIVAPMRVAINLDGNGQVPNNEFLWANDQITPSGTSYLPLLEDSNGLVVSDLRFCPWVIQGNSPIDLSAMTCTNVGASYPQFSSGIIGKAISSQNTNFVAAPWFIYLITTGASVITATLPAATGIATQPMFFKKVDSGSGIVNIVGTIDGTSGYSLVNQWEYVEIVSDNANYQITANN